MKPDLTNYHNSSLPLKNFLHFPEKNSGALSSQNSKKENKIVYPNIFLYFSKKIITSPGRMLTKCKISYTPYTLG